MSITWNDSFSVGIEKFDDQHKRLFKLIDELHQGIREGKGKFVVGNILDELQDYTSKHFLAEELEMMTHHYPDYETHKTEHDKLKAQVREFYSNFYAGKVVLSENVMGFLEEWLLNHIAKTDKKYAPYLNDKGVS